MRKHYFRNKMEIISSKTNIKGYIVNNFLKKNSFKVL